MTVITQTAKKKIYEENEKKKRRMNRQIVCHV